MKRTLSSNIQGPLRIQGQKLAEQQGTQGTGVYRCILWYKKRECDRFICFWVSLPFVHLCWTHVGLPSLCLLVQEKYFFDAVTLVWTYHHSGNYCTFVYSSGGGGHQFTQMTFPLQHEEELWLSCRTSACHAEGGPGSMPDISI